MSYFLPSQLKSVLQLGHVNRADLIFPIDVAAELKLGIGSRFTEEGRSQFIFNHQ